MGGGGVIALFGKCFQVLLSEDLPGILDWNQLLTWALASTSANLGVLVQMFSSPQSLMVVERLAWTANKGCSGTKNRHTASLHTAGGLWFCPLGLAFPGVSQNEGPSRNEKWKPCCLQARSSGFNRNLQNNTKQSQKRASN